MAGGQNKLSTGLPRWLVEANATTRAAALEAEQQRRPKRHAHCCVRGAEGQWPASSWTGAARVPAGQRWRRERPAVASW